MSNEPVIFSESILNRLAFPGHTLLGDQEPAGFESWHVATGRRAPTNSWRGSTTNQQRTLTVTCDRVRGCNMLAIDRNSNVRGAALSVQGSNDNFTTTRTVWTGTVPSAITSPGDLDNTNGVLTEEGAFLVRFTTDAYAYWRLVVPALGSGIVPIIGGAYLGMGLQLDYLARPYSENQHDVMRETVTIPASGWMGGTTPVPRRSGTLSLRLSDEWTYELARLHIEGHFLQRARAAWIIPNRNQAERAVLAVRSPGMQGFSIDSGWGFQQGNIGWMEHEPRVLFSSVA